MTARLLFVHAHPDDESITTGGTIAHYVQAGAEVSVLTCTLGEEGEVIGDRWAGLVADQSDQLGGYRISELSSALTALGVEGPRFLGGAGRYRDSGMAGTPAADHPRAFVNADPQEVVAALVAVIRELRPHVVVTYDAVGGYGHPDHIQAHRMVRAAVAASASDRFPGSGEPWRVPKLYWTVTEASAVADGVKRVGDLAAGWRLPHPGELAVVDDCLVTTQINVGGVLEAKVEALAAHATQISVATNRGEFALSNNIVQPILSTEHYVLAGGWLAGDLDVRAGVPRETDLLTGLDLPTLEA